MSETMIPITAGENSTAAIGVERVSGFTAPITLTVLDLPNGLSYQILQESDSEYALVLHASDQARAGAYSIRVVGSGDNLSHETSLQVRIKSGGIFKEIAFGIQIIHLIGVAVIAGIVGFVLSRRRSTTPARIEKAKPEPSRKAAEDKCPKCGGKLTFLSEFKEWYCYKCGAYYKPRPKKS